MNVLAKVQDVKHEVGKKITIASIATVAALNAMALSAFAEGPSGGSIDISAVTTSMTSSLTDLVGKVALACAGVVGAGLTIFGIQWAVRKVMSFFRAVGK